MNTSKGIMLCLKLCYWLTFNNIMLVTTRWDEDAFFKDSGQQAPQKPSSEMKEGRGMNSLNWDCLTIALLAWGRGCCFTGRYRKLITEQMVECLSLYQVSNCQKLPSAPLSMFH